MNFLYFFNNILSFYNFFQIKYLNIIEIFLFDSILKFNKYKNIFNILLFIRDVINGTIQYYYQKITRIFFQSDIHKNKHIVTAFSRSQFLSLLIIVVHQIPRALVVLLIIRNGNPRKQYETASAARLTISVIILLTLPRCQWFLC